MPKPSAKPPRKPCPCGQPAVKFKGSAPCCDRCDRAEQRMETENRRLGAFASLDRSEQQLQRLIKP